MKITDKMITDILYYSCCETDKCIAAIKKDLKYSGYEVEEEKTALEKYYEEEKSCYSKLSNYYHCEELSNLRKLYKNAIEEVLNEKSN